jgi:hypothetical protein
MTTEPVACPTDIRRKALRIRTDGVGLAKFPTAIH